jgi:hypothetical protein
MESLLSAWCDIGAGEEITIDYRLNAFDETCRWECCCGSAACPGWPWTASSR